MNYKRIYDLLIERAKFRNTILVKERHHIIPRCIGGCDDKDNLVDLTPREHYIAHLLLAKHYNIKPLWYAFVMMNVNNHRQNRSFNSRFYEKAKLIRKIYSSGENNPMYGKVGAFTGKRHSKESIEKMRASKIGKKRKPFTRSSPTEETRLKISTANKGKTSPFKGIPKEKVKCNHCDVMMDLLNIKLYHNDNCKLSPEYDSSKKNERLLKIKEAAQNRKKEKCIHCDVTATPSMLSRWHNENCRNKKL